MTLAKEQRQKMGAEHGPTARLQGLVNDAWLLLWVYKWGWTTNQIVQRLLNVKRPRPADDFAKKGLLLKIDAPSGHAERSVYILSDKGFIQAKINAENFDPRAVNNYTLHESKRIPWSLHNHNCVAQHICLDISHIVDKSRYPDEQDYQRLRTDFELKSEGAKSADIPDFIYQPKFNNPMQLHIEIELNQKTHLKLEKWLYPRIKKANNLFDETPDDAILILTPFDGVISSYSAALEKKVRRITINNGRDAATTQTVTLKHNRIWLTSLQQDKTRMSGNLKLVWNSGLIRKPCYIGTENKWDGQDS